MVMSKMPATALSYNSTWYTQNDFKDIALNIKPRRSQWLLHKDEDLSIYHANIRSNSHILLRFCGVKLELIIKNYKCLVTNQTY